MDPQRVASLNYINSDPQRIQNARQMMDLVEGAAALSPAGLRNVTRQKLNDIGTDLAKNDADPLGNGDQSIIQSEQGRRDAKQLHGLLVMLHENYDRYGPESSFAKACLKGDVKAVNAMIQSVCDNLEQPYSRQHQLKVLLETRETHLRLSPLLMVVVEAVLKERELPEIAKQLLLKGASPDCQDVLGLSAVHHGAQWPNSPDSMRIADMCICAARTSHLYGKEVTLEGLKNSVHLNGKRGIVGGYDYDANRRSVYIPELKKEIWAKPENICPVGGIDDDQPTILVDLPNRIGQVPLHEVVFRDHKESGELLLHKHHANIYITDADGISPVDKSLEMSRYETTRVGQMIAAIIRKQAKKDRDAKKAAHNLCSNCRKSLGMGGMKCSTCKVTFYCSRDCQVQHWKEGDHKQKCKEIVTESVGVELSSDHVDPEMAEFMQSLVFAQSFVHSFQNPEGVEIGEKFVVSVEAMSHILPLLIRDKSGTCQFQYKVTGPGYLKILETVMREPAWDGRKTFMKASFNAAGECTMYPSTACVKNKYAW